MTEEKKDEKVEDKKETKQEETKEETKKEEKTFTQEQVTAMMAEEKRQGKQSVLKQFGYKSEDELAQAVNKFKGIMDAITPEEDKAKEEAANKSTEADEWKLKAELAEAKVEALSLGAKPECVDDIIVLARTKKTDEGDWKTAVQEVKTKYENLFTKPDDPDDKDDKDNKGNKSKKSKGTGGNMSESMKDKKKDEQEDNYGAKLAKTKVKKETKHKSYFE